VESATKSTYKLGVGFKRCEDKGEKSASKFVPSSNYRKEEVWHPKCHCSHYSVIYNFFNMYLQRFNGK
jgi:hypothetical protein